MNNRILIVDDDDDFRSLLSDLYIQADYQVKSAANPLDALKMLSEEAFSLCVTDQSMPELKGIDFIDKARGFKPNMPIIMVSAYLSDDITAKLRDQKVEVFNKPLNIMSLLRKTSELIKNANNEEPAPASVASSPEKNSDEKITDSLPSSAPKLKTEFKAFAFKSDAAKRLKREIESIGDEIPNMVLVGDEGTHFNKICQDIEMQMNPEIHHFMYLINKKINVFDISKVIAEVPASKALVFALIEADNMGVAQKQALMKLHKRTGPFSDVANPIKFIFCLNEDLDTQFAKGSIDQDFYLIMGQKEIYVPRLDLCKEDISYLGNEIAADLISRNIISESFGGFNSEATELLIQSEWKNNYSSLQATIAKALKLAKGSTITRDHLEKAIAEPETIKVSESLVIPHPRTDRSQISPSQPQEEKSSGSQVSKPITNGNPAPKEEPRTNRKRNTTETPMIQSFTMLDDETELAKSILDEIVGS